MELGKMIGSYTFGSKRIRILGVAFVCLLSFATSCSSNSPTVTGEKKFCDFSESAQDEKSCTDMAATKGCSTFSFNENNKSCLAFDCSGC